MRRSLLLALVLILLVSGRAPAQTFEVETSVSEITGVRQIASSDLRPLPAPAYPGSHAHFRAVYEQDPDAGTSWTLVLFGYTPDTTAMSRTSGVRLRADGTKLQPIQVGSETRKISGTLLEVKRLSLTRSHFEQVARADSVTISVGPIQFEMDRILREDMRLILDRVSTNSAKRASESAPDTTETPNSESNR